MADMDEKPADTPPKNKGGRPPKIPKLSAEEIAELALDPTKGRRELVKEVGLGKNAASLIKKVTKVTLEEFQEIQRGKIQEVMDASLMQTKKMLPKASALQAATVYGIMGDKLNKPGPTSQTLHLHLNSGDRSGILSALLGKHAERVSGPESLNVKASVAPVVLDLPAAAPAPKTPAGE